MIAITIRALIWATALFIVGVLAFGCTVAMPPLPVAPGDYQGMADQAVATLSPHRGRVMVTPHGGDSFGHYYCRGSYITLGTAGNTRWLLAHEIGHHLNSHCDEVLSAEIEANDSAIKVLQVWGMTELQAVAETERHLLGLQQLRGNKPLHGHNYCAEYAAVVEKYGEIAAAPGVCP